MTFMSAVRNLVFACKKQSNHFQSVLFSFVLPGDADAAGCRETYHQSFFTLDERGF
jgi:hypothetical protein